MMIAYRLQPVIIFLYLVPIFFANVDFGAKGEFFLRSHLIFYPLLIVILLQKNVLPLKKVTLIISLLLVILLIYLGDTFLNRPYYLASSFASTLLFFTYVIVTYFFFLFVKKYDCLQQFYDLFYRFIKVSLILVIASWGIHFSSGIYVLADDGYGLFRPHALLSEPSALSLFVSWFFIRSIRDKRPVDLLIALTCMSLSGSLILIIVTFSTFLFYLSLSLSASRRLVLYIAILAIVHFVVQAILDYSRIGVDYLDDPLIKLKAALEAIVYLGSEGYNPRLNTVLDLFRFMLENNRLYLGMGPLSDTYLPFSSIAGSASSLLFMLIFNFGILVGSVIIVILLYNLLKLPDKSDSSVLFICCVITTSLNSAQGMLVYQIMLLVMLYAKNKENTFFRPF
ncbi:hypothetical protein ACMZOO_13120 [Catenovulum sp. SX2]|uniref:hypothetical protein n=1 Tax=Catenovulum sp. SX2 TaxID=3398614 RepID=UPI003F86C6CE